MNTKELVKYGFTIDLKGKEAKYLSELKETDFKSLEEEFAEKIADEEIYEETNDMPLRTGYPKPLHRYRLIYESTTNSIEEMYFWMLGHLKQDMAFPEIEKITDVYTASESSAVWGNMQQRLAIQQDRASQYLASIGKMVKELFQLVRELRILEERKELYDNWKESHSADVTLKGLFIDMVEGGSKNPTSVYGLAQQVGFTILPDLFFNTHITSLKAVDKEIDKMEYNPSIKNVLKRKLVQYISWTKNTDKEVSNKFNFTLRMLRQHWVGIKTNISWVKPYLRNIKRMSMQESHTTSAELISSFEGSIAEMEFLAKKKVGSHYAIVLATFQYRTMPTLSYQTEGYQRGPIHVGRADVKLRAYAWTEDQIDKYKKMKDKEDRELIGYVDASLENAMDALEGDIEKYLELAEEPLKKKNKEEKKEKEQQANALEPFKALFQGVNELFIPNIKFRKKGKKKGKLNPKNAEKTATGAMWQVYKNYKKSHGLVAW